MVSSHHSNRVPLFPLKHAGIAACPIIATVAQSESEQQQRQEQQRQQARRAQRSLGTDRA